MGSQTMQMRGVMARFALPLIAILSVVSCEPPPPPPPPKSQLQTREFQTREYDSQDPKLVMKAVLNVLQDDGYIVHNAVMDLGLITASKDLEVEHVNNSSPFSLGSGFGTRRRGGFGWGGFGGGGGGGEQDGRGSRSSTIEVSVNVSEFGRSTRVRANFQKRTSDGRGGVVESHQVDEQKFYQEFFSKVDKGVFLQREKL